MAETHTGTQRGRFQLLNLAPWAESVFVQVILEQTGRCYRAGKHLTRKQHTQKRKSTGRTPGKSEFLIKTKRNNRSQMFFWSDCRAGMARQKLAQVHAIKPGDAFHRQPKEMGAGPALVPKTRAGPWASGRIQPAVGNWGPERGPGNGNAFVLVPGSR